MPEVLVLTIEPGRRFSSTRASSRCLMSSRSTTASMIQSLVPIASRWVSKPPVETKNTCRDMDSALRAEISLATVRSCVASGESVTPESGSAVKERAPEIAPFTRSANCTARCCTVAKPRS